MKLSTGMIGTLLFTAVATAAFVWMAKRPSVDGNAMIFGMPMSSAVMQEKAEEKMPEATMPASTPTTETPTLDAEPSPVEETTTTPATSDESAAPSEIEIKIEEMPATTTPEPGEAALESTEPTTN